MIVVMDKFVFMDFDGVLNFEGSRNQMRKNPDAGGYLRRATLFENGVGYGLNWSAEVVRKLMELKETTGYMWVWVTSWTGLTYRLDWFLDVKSDLDLVWNPDPPVRAWSSYSDSEVGEYRKHAKLQVLELFMVDKPDAKFVWVDDEATVLWKPGLFKQDSLAVTPNPKFGLTLPELEVMKTFLV